MRVGFGSSKKTTDRNQEYSNVEGWEKKQQQTMNLQIH